MWECQHGVPLPHGGYTGSVCRKPLLCREEGRCAFVAGLERYLERHNGQMPADPIYLKRPGRPNLVVWHVHQYDEQPSIQWHPGTDGFAWAL